MYFRGLVFVLLNLIFSATSALADIDFKRHVIVVLDNSGTVFDRDDYANYDRFYAARQAIIQRLGREYDREDLVTIISVARSKVIWQGSASRIDRRKFTGTLLQYLNKEIGGCAAFDDVLKTIEQQESIHRLPITRVLFLSSLAETGPHPCTFDPNDIVPTEAFFKGMNALMLRAVAKVDFWWVDEDVYDRTLEAFANLNYRVSVKRIEETILELTQ